MIFMMHLTRVTFTEGLDKGLRLNSSLAGQLLLNFSLQISTLLPTLNYGWSVTIYTLSSVLAQNTKRIEFCILNHSEAQHNCVLHLSTKIYSFIIWLTDGLCCTISCRSYSHKILSNHWHTIIAWGRIWGWLKCVITPSSCACSNVHNECIHKRSTLESGLVLCDDSPWTLTCFHRVQWILEAKILKNNKQIKISELWL